MKNNGTKFILKCILALVPFFIFMIYAGLFRMFYMDSEYPSWKYTKDVQSKIISPVSDEEDSVLILGDSRAMADLDPCILGDNVVNLAFGGATSIEMYYTLNEYLKNHSAPKAVLIYFAPFHYSYMDNFWTRTAYFHHIDSKEAAEVYIAGKKCASETINSENFTKLISTGLYLPDTYLPAISNAKIFMRFSENKSAYSRLCLANGHDYYGTADGCSDLNYEASYETMRKTGDYALIFQYMNKLLSLCETNGIDTYIDQVPMNEASYNSLNPEFVKSYREYMQDIANGHPECTVYTDIPCYRDDYFGDSSHLNQTGSAIFSEEIKNKYTHLLSK